MTKETKTDPARPTDPTGEKLGHQPDFVNVRRIVVIGAALGVVVAGAMVGMVAMQSAYERTPEQVFPDWVVLPGDEPPLGPELEPNQSEQLCKLRAAHDEILSSYAWLDDSRQTARVPIDRAIDILLSDDSLPARSTNDE